MTTYDFVGYSGLPEHMQEGAREYVEQGHAPGGFLYAVLCNNLVDAFGHADSINAACMSDWANWLHNEAPSTCWGSPEKVAAWMLEYERHTQQEGK